MPVEHDAAGEEVLIRPPAHPVPSLQGPFEESMVESVNEAAENDIPLDAIMRRSILLDSVYYQRVVAGRWKQKPGEKYHPLWKLVAQMSFGLHLLARSMAKSEDEVMKILQAHVDDIDGFLERTAEDFDLAQDDMQERLKCLRLPLQHGDVFDRMLEDRAFRASILEGNEKIEHIVRRTKRALKDALKDVQKGFDASNVLDKYLSGLTSTWERQSPEHEAVLVAMLGNVEGWRRAFMELHLQGNKLAGTLKKLTEVVGEMERRAAAVSRDIVADQQQAKSRVTSNPVQPPTSTAGSRASAQKPLPGPPGHRSSTRGSSRSTHIPEYPSKLNSADFSSGSRPQSKDSPQTHSGEQTPSTLSTNMIASNATPRDGTPRKSTVPAKTMPIQEELHTEVLIELPADVPEDVMRNAPVSVKNRLSMTLGLKAKDNADHRVSSVYYPNALRDLLKMPQSPQYKASPQLVAARGTAVRSDTPVTDSDADYFSAHERSPSIGHITPDTKKFLESNATTPENIIPRVAVRSPTVPQEDQSRPSSVPNPGLTSHRAVMQMAAPPVELPAVAETVGTSEPERPVSRSRQQSQSSLGEPGPEIAESEGETVHQDVEIAVVPLEEPKREAPKPPSIEALHELGARSDSTIRAPTQQPRTLRSVEDADTTTPVVATGVPEQTDPSHNVEAGIMPSNAVRSVTKESIGDASKEDVPSNQTVEHITEDHQIPTVHDGIALEILPPGGDPPLPDASVEDVDEPANEDTITTFIAELEAVAPQKASRPITVQPSSPIELEAPVQTFVLPPRSKAKLTQGKDWSSATIKDRADFFKLPNEQSVKPGLKPKDFRGTKIEDAGPIRPLRLKLQKFEGKLVPVQVHTPPKDMPDSPARTSRLSQDTIANLIEQLSNTPPGSPPHNRAESIASSNSAQIGNEPSSRSFGPPESAPAPPGPGGRSMVSPDYASIGQFEGERKQTNRGSRGSKGSLKEILGSSRRNSSDVSTKSPGQHSRVQSLSARGSGNNDMLTSAGKDVLWFKEEGKSPVGVTSN